ncbi:MAG TPA: DUF1361 domain-containing protein [Gaiellaceae bacterium]|jgi:uncharacterized membrane protein
MRLSDRRVLTLVLLGLASGLCVALVAVHTYETGARQYGFLVWNLFLAWLPFLLALVLYDGYRRARPALVLAGVGAAWLLFFPNAPYILTDFVHLDEPSGAPLWYDGAMIAAFAFTGLLLGLGSLFLVQNVVAAAYGRLCGWLVSGVALALASVGIYLGRFVGVNSWDALVDPGRVLAPFAEHVDDPLAQTRFLALTLVLTGFLSFAYLLLYAIANLGLELEPRRRSAAR